MPYTDSHSFLFQSDWLDLCPMGVIALDESGSIRWANETMLDLLAIAPEHLIGKTRDTLPTHAALFNGESLIKVLPEQGGERWLRCTLAAVEDNEGKTVHLHFYEDSSREVEAQMQCNELEQKLLAMSGTDSLTGLANQHTLLQVLEEQVTRSRRYNNPLSIVLLRTERTDATPGHEDARLPEETLVEIGQSLRDRLRWADTVGRYDDSCFMLILPETVRTAAENLVGDIQDELTRISLPDGSPLLCRVGFAEWRKGSDPHLLVQHALETTLSAAND